MEPAIHEAAIAFEHGFYELGRFAACYAAQFGEPPSITLSRADPVSIRSVLIYSAAHSDSIQK